MWLVAAGGALGALLRYALTLMIGSKFTQPGALTAADWPWATWSANALGCCCIGLLWGMSSQAQWFTDWGRTFVLVGVLGGFTTYSTFALETLRLFDQGRLLGALVYALITLLSCLLLVWIGRYLGQMVGQWVQSA